MYSTRKLLLSDTKVLCIMFYHSVKFTVKLADVVVFSHLNYQTSTVDRQYL